MQRLISKEDVCSYLHITVTAAVEPQIDVAHTLVASCLRVDTLDRDSHTAEKHKPKFDTNLIELRHGPIHEVQAVRRNGRALDLDDLLIGRWTIRNPDGWARHDVIEVDYTTGFQESSSEDVPTNVLDALTLTAAKLYSRSTSNADPTITSERIGDYSYTRSNPSDAKRGDLPVEAEEMLLEYKRPRL
jgi:hypothetical protein